MKTTTFTNRGAFYGCSEPGDQSGEYVKADVVKGLVEALNYARSTLYERMSCDLDFKPDIKARLIAEHPLMQAIDKALEDVK